MIRVAYFATSNHLISDALVMLFDLGLGLGPRLVDSRGKIRFQELDIAPVCVGSVGIFSYMLDGIESLRKIPFCHSISKA